VQAFPGVVFREAAFEIVRVASIEFTRGRHAFQNVCVKHKIKEGWPAIRSPEPVLETALLRSQSGAAEGTILRPELRFEVPGGGWCISTVLLEPFFKDRRLLHRLEAMGVEPL